LIEKLEEAKANYQTMLDENVSNIERARKAEKERDALIPIAEAAKNCPKACVIAPKRDSRCPSCECLIVCDALKAADIESNSAEGKIVERLKGANSGAVPVGLDSATGDEILATIDAMEKAEWQYLLKTARELAKMYDGRDGVIRDEGDLAMKAEAGATRRAPGGVDIRHR
jgi:hypothetical protein